MGHNIYFKTSLKQTNSNSLRLIFLSFSIFLSILSARNWSKKNKGIINPEVILSSSAHPAFLKATQFLNVKPIVIPTKKNYKLDLELFNNSINANTILLVGSAPNYPYGMIDPINELSKKIKVGTSMSLVRDGGKGTSFNGDRPENSILLAASSIWIHGLYLLFRVWIL